MKYRAKTLADIADHFDAMAAGAKSKRDATMKNRGRETQEAIKLAEAASVWTAAAELIRNTEIEAT